MRRYLYQGTRRHGTVRPPVLPPIQPVRTCVLCSLVRCSCHVIPKPADPWILQAHTIVFPREVHRG